MLSKITTRLAIVAVTESMPRLTPGPVRLPSVTVKFVPGADEEDI